MELPLAAYDTGAGASGMKTNKQTLVYLVRGQMKQLNMAEVFYVSSGLCGKGVYSMHAAIGHCEFCYLRIVEKVRKIDEQKNSEL